MDKQKTLATTGDGSEEKVANKIAVRCDVRKRLIELRTMVEGTNQSTKKVGETNQRQSVRNFIVPQRSSGCGSSTNKEWKEYGRRCTNIL